MIIDGAIQRQVYWKIGFPPGTTGMVVIGIVALRDCKMTGSRPVVLTGIVLSTIPALLLYLFGQEYLVEGSLPEV